MESKSKLSMIAAGERQQKHYSTLIRFDDFDTDITGIADPHTAKIADEWAMARGPDHHSVHELQ
jgi:hypothetical protein